MRLSSKHVFLVPSWPREHSQRQRIIKFTGFFFLYLLFLIFENARLTTKSRQEKRLASDLFFWKKVIEVNLDPHPNYSRHVERFLSIVLNVFRSKADGDLRLPKELRIYDANKDKLSIVLNSIDNGLAIHRSSTEIEQLNATEDDCFRYLLMLALVARDPMALCTAGLQLRLHSTSPSWLSRPVTAETHFGCKCALSHFPTHSHIRIDPEPRTAFIELSILCVVSSRTCHLASRPAARTFLHSANRFIDGYMA